MRKLYLTLPNLYNDSIKLNNKKMFITPYKGVASLFISQSVMSSIHKVVKQKSIKLEYAEWENNSACVDMPLSNITLYIKNLNFKPFNIKATGYIYTIDYDKYKDNIGKISWMQPDKEAFISGISEIEFESVEKCIVNINVEPKDYYKVEEVSLKDARKLILKNEYLEAIRRGVKFTAERRKNCMDYFNDKAFHYFMIKDFALLAMCYHEDLNAYEISEVFIEEKYRGKHLAIRLFDHVFSKFKDKDYVVEVSANNSIGISLYTRVGFKPVITLNHDESNDYKYTTIVMVKKITGTINIDV